MQDLPLVSVVIPTHNRVALVQRALASVRSQTYPHLEIIVVDDGSTDATSGSLANDTDVNLVSLPESVGGAAARNRGITKARGELIAFLDSDDEWLPSKIEKQVPRFADPAVGAVYCRHLSEDDETGVRVQAASSLYTGDIRPQLFSGRCPRTVSLFMVRTRALSEVGGFDENLRGFQDTDLWMRLAENWHFDAVDDYLAVVHNHPEARITTDIDARRAALDAFLARWGEPMTREMGADGVRRYRRSQLAVAQGSAVLGLVRSGQRLPAWGEYLSYLREIGLSNPRQAVGLLVALVAGTETRSRLKRRRQDRSQRQ